MSENQLVECIPNFSEGQDLEKIEKIVDAFRCKEGVKLLNYSNDRDHNRMVITAIGTPEALKKAVIEAIGIAVEIIDLSKHKGEHPRLGAADVVPFIPIKNYSMEEVILLSQEVGKIVAERYNLPVFFYEKTATMPHRENLALVRKGQFEGLGDKMKLAEWQPDFGPATPHSTAGAVIIGARMPLIAYNINLDTDSLDIADKIAKKVRFSSGGLPCCKAMGVELRERKIVQVSMNLTDYHQTGMHQVFEMVKSEALQHGVRVLGSELIGLVPLQAVAGTLASYLGLEDFSEERILEWHLTE